MPSCNTISYPCSRYILCILFDVKKRICVSSSIPPSGLYLNSPFQTISKIKFEIYLKLGIELTTTPLSLSRLFTCMITSQGAYICSKTSLKITQSKCFSGNCSNTASKLPVSTKSQTSFAFSAASEYISTPQISRSLRFKVLTKLPSPQPTSKIDLALSGIYFNISGRGL